MASEDENKKGSIAEKINFGNRNRKKKDDDKKKKKKGLIKSIGDKLGF